uniref:Uncharacterized protein n=1 Tax=Rhizophora mucronata TaxID=61149 RepID=A0A2P2NDI9_RHIMU
MCNTIPKHQKKLQP